MNHDPIMFCQHCQLPKKRGSFRTVRYTKNNRKVCAECYLRIVAAHERIKKGIHEFQ